jgi:predicted  nucleic acid-binding Zn-ribbon protein
MKVDFDRVKVQVEELQEQENVLKSKMEAAKKEKDGLKERCESTKGAIKDNREKWKKQDTEFGELLDDDDEAEQVAQQAGQQSESENEALSEAKRQQLEAEGFEHFLKKKGTINHAFTDTEITVLERDLPQIENKQQML